MPDKEHSAGGVIFEDGTVLLILVKNLGGKVWTFPKGRLESGETPETAALREVAEETGWDCEIISPLYKTEYSFLRGNMPVDKDVRWFLMKRVGGDGLPKTPDEVLSMKWLSLADAENDLFYKTDLEIINLLKKLGS